MDARGLRCVDLPTRERRLGRAAGPRFRDSLKAPKAYERRLNHVADSPPWHGQTY